jgi:predicted transcriptional regulator
VGLGLSKLRGLLIALSISAKSLSQKFRYQPCALLEWGLISKVSFESLYIRSIVVAQAGTKVLTAHIPLPLAEKVDQMAERLGRSRGWIMKQALSAWLEQEVERECLTLEALAYKRRSLNRAEASHAT